VASVLDSSAVLALLQAEPGAAIVLAHLSDSVISSVNVAEIIRVLTRKGSAFKDARQALALLQLPVIPFDHEQALVAAEIGSAARHLSLGDCACVALAKSDPASEVLTADRIWAEIDLGIKVTLIR